MSNNQKPKRQFSTGYERVIPVILAVLVIVFIGLLFITVMVGLGLLPGIH